jgi:5'-3' exoribonuclease 2
MNQQRARRYMAAWRHGALTIPQWDTNAITPGTAFMELLSDALYEWVHSKRLPSDVTVSDAAQKGEGEQKLFSAIRNSPSSSNSIYVYGLDADLILMAMRCPARDRMYIVREQAEALQLIDIKKLAEGVAKDMAMPALDSDVDIVGARLRDFAALCALLGNDFVPALPGLRIREGAVRLLVGAYKRARSCMGNGSRLASDAGPDILGGLDVRLLGALLREVALREGELLAAADKRYYQRVRWAASAPAALLADPEEVYPAMHPPQFGPDAVRPGDGSAWRLRYYHHVFGGVSNAASVRATCLQYLCGLGWTLCYLGDQRCLSEGWCYDMHAHAPTAHDMCNLLMDDGLSREVEEVMEATHRAHRDAASAGGPQWPLLMVLPPASANLIRDAALRALITDPRYAHAFPTGFKLDTYLKDRLWECHPVLPPLFCWPASHG